MTTTTYPHPALTKIIGKPTPQCIATLKKEIYANARSQHSTRGGGNNGHLAIVMPPAEYLNRTGTAFNPIAHPGPQPVHAAGATQFQIQENIRQYNQNLQDFNRFQQIKGDLKQMIIAAVDSPYYDILEDPDMGYGDVDPIDFMDHLIDAYGEISQDDIEANRSILSEPWDPTNEIEGLWTRIRKVQQFATRAGEEITDAAVMRLTLKMFEKENLYEFEVSAWHNMLTANQTIDAFRTHFKNASKAFNRKLTAKQAGYDAAALAAKENKNEDTKEPPTKVVGPKVSIDTYTMCYCWTHGLTPGRNHSSANCRNPAEGHQIDATVVEPKGGNMKFTAPRILFQNRNSNNRRNNN